MVSNPRNSADLGPAAVMPRSKTKAAKAAAKRAASATTDSAAAQNIARERVAPNITVLTIGHSTRTIEEFLATLAAHGVQRLLDVPTIPKSPRLPPLHSHALA